MQLARLLIYWQLRRWVAGCFGLMLGSGVGPAVAQQEAAPIGAAAAPSQPTSAADAQSDSLLPPPTRLPQAESSAAVSPGLGSPHLAVSAGPALASFFSRPLFGGSLSIAGGAMLSSSLGLVVQSRLEIGQLNLRYLLVSSGRIGLGLLARLGERVTLSAGLGGGLIGFTRNSTRVDVITPLVALDLSADVDLLRWLRLAPATATKYQASDRLFLSLALGLLTMPLARDSFLEAAARIGLGYRYR